MADGAPLPGERWILRHRLLAPYAPPRVRRAIRLCASLGSPRAAATTVALGAAGLARGDSRRAAGELLLSAGVGPAGWALKRHRGPTPRFVAELGPTASTANYPSGHVAYAVSVFGQLGRVARRARHPGLAAGAALAAVAVATARAFDGSHLPGDVLGGAALGGAWLSLTVALTSGHGPRRARALRNVAAMSVIVDQVSGCATARRSIR